MKINQHNTEIANICATSPIQTPDGKTRRIDLFYFTKTGTLAVAENATFAIEVSAEEPAEKPFAVHPDTLPDFTEGDKVKEDLHIIFDTRPTPEFEVRIGSELLLAIAKAASTFSDGTIRIGSHGQTKPVTFEMSGDGGQLWKAYLMPRKPLPPVPAIEPVIASVEDEVAAALAKMLQS